MPVTHSMSLLRLRSLQLNAYTMAPAIRTPQRRLCAPPCRGQARWRRERYLEQSCSPITRQVPAPTATLTGRQPRRRQYRRNDFVPRCAHRSIVVGSNRDYNAEKRWCFPCSGSTYNIYYMRYPLGLNPVWGCTQTALGVRMAGAYTISLR